MGMWGGAGAGGWSQGIGGQANGPRGARTTDGWDDDYLGKVYDAEVVKRVWPYLIQYKKQAGIAFACMLISAATAFAQPLVVGFAITEGVRGNSNAVIWLCGVMVAMALLQWGAAYLQQLTTAWMGTRILLRLRSEMYDHMVGLSLSFYDEMEVGRMISRLTSDVQVVQDLLTTGSLTSLSNIFGVFVIAGILFYLDWELALITLAVVPPLILVMVWWSSHARKAFMNVRVKLSALYGTLAENVSGVRAVQSMSREDENSRRFDALNQDNRNANIWAGMLSAAVMPVIELAVALATAAVIIVGGIRAINANTVDVAALLGLLAAFTLYVNRFFDPIRDLVLQYTMFQRAMAGGERIFEVLDTKARITDRPDALELDAVEGRVDFDHVDFHYVEGVPILQDIDLHVEPGETIAFVGHTGAGKTTITSLVSRGYEVTGGAIRVDGHDIRDIKRRSLTRHMGVMLQQRGQNLSLGQRQLISFARAILAAPRILVLDEATAYVDTQTEVIIQRALDELLKNRTSFVIAHRLSTIRRANRIVVLDRGKMVEIGTHEELLARGGVYANLYRMTYEQEKAHEAEVMAGEDEAFARRRQGEMMGEAQPAS